MECEWVPNGRPAKLLGNCHAKEEICQDEKTYICCQEELLSWENILCCQEDLLSWETYFVVWIREDLSTWVNFRKKRKICHNEKTYICFQESETDFSSWENSFCCQKNEKALSKLQSFVNFRKLLFVVGKKRKICQQENWKMRKICRQVKTHIYCQGKWEKFDKRTLLFVVRKTD